MSSRDFWDVLSGLLGCDKGREEEDGVPRGCPRKGRLRAVIDPREVVCHRS